MIVIYQNTKKPTKSPQVFFTYNLTLFDMKIYLNTNLRNLYKKVV